jgi:hypothetical protein
MSDLASLNFVGIYDGRLVYATYANLPLCQIVIVSQTSGQSFGGVDVDGSGSTEILIPAGMAPGPYYLEPQRNGVWTYLTRSAVFNIGGPAEPQ